MTDDTTRDTEQRQHDREGDEDRRRQSAAVKVTDKRMFGPDGELREEYSFLEQEGSAESKGGAEPDQTGRGEIRGSEAETAAEPPPQAPPGGGSAGPGGRPSPETGAAPGEPQTGATGGPALGGPGPLGQPSFLDLVSVLAEPVAVYLGDVKLPDGRNAENLDMARFHIDLLDILRQKTEGQLSEQEKAVLDDLLYRLRMRFVQKRDAERSELENRSDIETPG